jgi:hypothetical protein
VTGHQKQKGRFHEAALLLQKASHVQGVTGKWYKRVLANRSLCAYPKNCLVNRPWVPIAVWLPENSLLGAFGGKGTGLQ